MRDVGLDANAWQRRSVKIQNWNGVRRLVGKGQHRTSLHTHFVLTHMLMSEHLCLRVLFVFFGEFDHDHF